MRVINHRSSVVQMFFKTVALMNIVIFRGKNLCWSLFHKFADLFPVFRLNTERYWYREILVFSPNTGRRPATLLKRNSNQHRCFPVNIMKFLRTAFSTGCRWLFLKPQAYLETSQTSVREPYLKKKALISRKLFSQKTESQIFDWVLNTPLWTYLNILHF